MESKIGLNKQKISIETKRGYHINGSQTDQDMAEIQSWSLGYLIMIISYK